MTINENDINDIINKNNISINTNVSNDSNTSNVGNNNIYTLTIIIIIHESKIRFQKL